MFEELLRELLLDTLLLFEELLRLLPLDTLLLFEELLRELPLDTLLLREELLRLLPLDTLLLFEELLRELDTEEELLREELDEPVDLLLLSLFTEVPEVLRRVLVELLLPVRVVPVVPLLRVDVLTPESLRREEEVLPLRVTVEVERLLVPSARLEPVRVGVSEVMTVRRFSSESTFTLRLPSLREGIFTYPALRSRRLFS